jgi:hypothetical protein
MKKLQLTKLGEVELDRINELIIQDVDYHDLSKEDQLIADIGMYVDEAYGENQFNSLEEFIAEAMSVEFVPEYITEKRIKRRVNKIKKAIKENICEIVEIEE